MGDNAARRLATGQGTCPRGGGGGGGKALHTRSALDQALHQASCAPPPPAPLGSGASLCGRARRKRGGNSETGNSEPRHALRRARVPFSLQSRARLPGDLVVPRQSKPAPCAPWASIRQAVGRHTRPQPRSERTAAAAAAAAALESVGWIMKCVCCRDGHIGASASRQRCRRIHQTTTAFVAPHCIGPSLSAHHAAAHIEAGAP